jgi:AcrR family transcriptional regulator
MIRKATPKRQPPAKPRKSRVDGQRNRQHLLEIGRKAFTEFGAQVSLETIAKRAGVGIGTLYRHFPSREALIEAVCRAEVEQLALAASQLLEKHAPGDGLHRWMRLYVDFIATNKLLASAVSTMLGPSSYRSSVAQITDNPVLGSATEFYRSTTALFMEAAGFLLERAYRAGDIKIEIKPRDLLRALSGFTATYGDDVQDWEASARLLVDIFFQGLRGKPGKRYK